MKAVVIKDCHNAFNDYDYTIGDIIEVTELEKFKSDYVIYYSESLDWIPKDSVEIINE
ncbi:hypothetical protein [Bacillus glycinifermentans]|uniref:hypothetical protein n=1 Tax=Bacillus glycinifermentans TaxID=1664069 RepID=UPI001583A7E6|nr:hypothetical protein [Bacillus glycinifermentans]